MIKCNTKSQMVADTIRREIENQVYSQNVPLMPEHQLAARFKVNRLTIRRALDDLASEGLVLRRQGVGTFVTGGGPVPMSLPVSSTEPAGVLHFAILSAGKINDYSNLQLTILQRVLSENDCFAPIICEEAIRSNPYKLIKRLREMNCNGVIIYFDDYGKTSKWLRFFRDHDFNCAVPRYVADFDDCYCGTANEFGKFTEAVSEEAVNYLVELGHRKIAFLADTIHELGDYSLRLRGFLRGVNRHGLSGEYYAVGSMENGVWNEQLLNLVQEKQCTAVMCFNDAEAVVAIRLLNLHQIRVPEDVSIIGFGSFYQQELNHLTTIPVPLDEFSLEIYRLLKAKAHQQEYVHRTTPYLVRIQKGGTCAPPVHLQ